MAVTVLENTDKQFYLVLPPEPADELSDETIGSAAGAVIFSALWSNAER
jgi:hypothetical protein